MLQQARSYWTFFKSEISAGKSYSCMQPPLFGWSCTSARTTFWPRFQPDFRPKLRLQSGAYAAHKVCHLLLQFLPLNLPQSRFGFCFFVLPFYTFGYFFLLNHAFSFAFHSLSCFIISHPPTDHHTSNSSDIAQNSSTGPSYKIWTTTDLFDIITLLAVWYFVLSWTSFNFPNHVCW